MKRFILALMILALVAVEIAVMLLLRIPCCP